MPRYTKFNFYGGLNQRVDSTRVDANSEYYVLMNARTRRNVITPITVPEDITAGLPTDGILQGIYAVNGYLVAFAGGLAYYRLFDPDSGVWNQISGFSMSATASRIYLELIPASSVNLKRVTSSTSTTVTDPILRPPIAVRGTPQCAIVMDGVSQPWVIFPDATARVTQTYAQWTSAIPEYVPIAKFPKRVGSRLYCVGPDANGVFNQIYGSVTGQYLNFVVAITSDGSKTSTSETVGGAPALADSVDFSAVTCLQRLPNASAEAFYVGTIKNSNLVALDYTRTIYGEPTHIKQFLFEFGALNQEAVLPDIDGDSAIVGQNGIRSFNSILQFRTDGRNSPFSQEINDIINGIIQTTTATTVFDNYAVFAVTTRYGPAILWYDTLMKKWAAIDRFDSIGDGGIKQFAVMQTPTARKLFFITGDNRLLEYFGGSTTAPVRIYIADLLAPKGGHAIQDVKLEFGPCTASGHVQCTVLADEQIGEIQSQTVDVSDITTGEYDSVPYTPSGGANAQQRVFSFGSDPIFAKKTGVLIEYSCAAPLTSIDITTEEAVGEVREPVKAITNPEQSPTTVVLLGNDGEISATRTALHNAITRTNPDYIIGLGNHTYEDGTEAECTANMLAYWSTWRNNDKFFAVPGAYDINTDVGEPFFQALHQAPTRYFKLTTPLADFFMIHGGYNEAGTQVEADNLNEATIEESRQMQWLRTQLAASTKQHKIVVMHHTPHCSADGMSGGVIALQAIPFASWGATALIGAQGRVYERIYADGLWRFISGLGCSRFGTITTPISESYKQITGETGYLRMTIHALSIKCEFVSVNGTILDTFLLSR